MKRTRIISKKYWYVAALLMLVLPILGACMPTQSPTEQPGKNGLLTPTVQVVQPTAEPTSITSGKPSPTPNPATQYNYSGFMVFADQQFVRFDFNGNGVVLQPAKPGTDIFNPQTASVFNNGLIYVNTAEGKIAMVTADGVKSLDFISTDKPVVAVISPDGSKIAWSYQIFGGDAPGSELWIANIDGSNQQKIDEVLPADNAQNWIVLQPDKWLSDGRLLYGAKLTGIGGYILYDGWNDLRVYNPADGSKTVLVQGEPATLNIYSLSDDLSMVALGTPQITIRKLSDGKEITLPAVVEQNVAGDAQFSPSGAWIAYAVARLNPDNERSQVVVAPSDGSGDLNPIQTMEGGEFHVLGWINEDTFLFSTHTTVENSVSIWRINRDGSNPVKLIDGQFLGFIPRK